MADLEAFGVAVAGTARDLQDENVALRAKIAALEAQLAAVTPWVVRGYLAYQAAWAYVVGDGGILVLCSYQDTPACDAVWMAVFPDGRPMPKPSHIP